MEWYRELYLGEKAEKKKEKLIQMAESGKTPVNTYLLTLPSDQRNQLEILPAWQIKFWHGDKQCPMVIGLACGKQEAVSLVQRITEDVLRQTGTADLRDYFLKKCNCKEASETTKKRG